MKRIFALTPLMLILLAGCIFSSEKYIAPETYDLGTDYETSSVPVRSIRVWNTSGADRRFLYRAKNNRMIFDEYNYWILSPEQLLRKSLESVFVKNDQEAVKLDCSIEKFEFDLSRMTAELKLAVTFEKNGRRIRQIFSGTEKFKEKKSAEAALAMDRCVRRLFGEISRACAENSVKLEKKK